MRLKFHKREWLHVLMAVSAAQKVLTDRHSPLYTHAWDSSVGRFISEELRRLVGTAPSAPQVATKLDFAAVADALPEGLVVKPPAPEVANAPTVEPRVAELEKHVSVLQGEVHTLTDKVLDLMKGIEAVPRVVKFESDMATLVSVVQDLEAKVIAQATAAAPVEKHYMPKHEAFEHFMVSAEQAMNDASKATHKQFLKVYDFIAKVEDRLLALERKRK